MKRISILAIGCLLVAMSAAHQLQPGGIRINPAKVEKTLGHSSPSLYAVWIFIGRAVSVIKEPEMVPLEPITNAVPPPATNRS